jgi:hypothetical protein
MFWTVTLIGLAVLLAAAWLFDRRARRKHELKNLDGSDNVRYGQADGSGNHQYGGPG